MELRKAHKELLLSALVLMIPVLLFHGVTRFYFVSFDDGEHLYRNPLLSPPNWDHFKYLWSHIHNGLYVPVTYTIWGLVAKLSLMGGKAISLNPGLFHSLNLGLHAINTLLVYVLFRRLNLETIGCLLGALLFAMHPLQVESFAWISSFDGLLSSAFALSSLLCWIDWLKGGQWLLWSSSFALFLCAVLSKPGAVTLPLLYFGVSVFLRSGKNLKNKIIPLLPFFVFSLLFALLAKAAQPNGNIKYVTPWMARPLVAIDALCFYFSKLIFPFSLSVNYGRTPDLVLAAALLKVEVLLFILGVFYFARCKKTAESLLALWLFFSALIPVLGFVPFYFQKYSTVADRYMYLALLGPCFLLAHQVGRSRKVWVWGIVVIILFWFGLKSRQQMRYWETDTTNVYRTAQVHPTADHHFNLAEMLWAEMEGRNPVPSAPMRPLAIPRSEAEKVVMVTQIKFHYEEALRLKEDFNLGRYRLAQFKAQYH